MADRIRTKTDGERDRLNTHDIAAIKHFSSLPSDKIRFDDLIVSLANAHENRRAQQVTEWESLGRRQFPLYI